MSNNKESEQYRIEGNEHFRANRFHNALNCYTKSLECKETATVLSNRAQTYLNLNEYEKALADATRACELEPQNEKALFRKVKALIGLQLFEVAAENQKKLQAMRPKNRAASKMQKNTNGKANIANLRLKYGEKDEFLRSKTPLKQITDIRVIGEKKEPKNESATVSKPTKLDLHIPPAPSTSFAFITDYQALKEKSELFAQYFLGIDSSDYENIMGELIDAEMLEVLMDGFAAIVCSGNVLEIVDCLIQITSVSRFDVALMMMDTKYKDVLWNTLQKYMAEDSQWSTLNELYGS